MINEGLGGSSRPNTSAMADKRPTALQVDKAGDFFADYLGSSNEARVKVSLRRQWYAPPRDAQGEVDYEVAADELSGNLTSGTVVIRSYLQNGELGYATEIPVESKEDLERLLRMIRKVYKDGVKKENAIRKAALARCEAMLTELEHSTQAAEERRMGMERRTRHRRGRRLLGWVRFRNDDRRLEPDRRCGRERRTA